MGTLRESMTGETTMREVVEKELGEEVVACAALSQGTPPSMLSLVTGAALIKLVSPRASKELPKRFILAVTTDKVVALKGTPISDEDGNDTGAHIRGVIATWDRGEVTAAANPDGRGGTLQIPGASVPVFDRSIDNPRERELFMALGG
jgi:hypothetical protein